MEVCSSRVQKSSLLQSDALVCYGKPLFILIDFRRYLQTLLFVLLFDHIFPGPKGALRKRTGTREVKTLHYHMRMLDFALPTEVLASQLVHKGDL